MIQHLHSIICGRTIVDRHSNLASYIDILQEVTTRNADKIRIPSINIVSKFWVKEGIEDNQVLELKFLKKKNDKSKWNEIETIQLPLERKGDNLLIDFRIENLIFEESGLWEFEVRWKLKESHKWNKTPTIPFKVSVAAKTTFGEKE